MKALACVALLVIGGCGTVSAAPATQISVPTRAPQMTPAPQVAPLISDTCVAIFGELYDAESALSARLDVGMVEAEYLTAVGDVSVHYRATTRATIHDLDCLRLVAVPLEQAFAAYSAASSTWNRCVVDFACRIKTVRPKLQAKWTTASDLLERIAKVWPG